MHHMPTKINPENDVEGEKANCKGMHNSISLTFHYKTTKKDFVWGYIYSIKMAGEDMHQHQNCYTIEEGNRK